MNVTVPEEMITSNNYTITLQTKVIIINRAISLAFLVHGDYSQMFLVTNGHDGNGYELDNRTVSQSGTVLWFVIQNNLCLSKVFKYKFCIFCLRKRVNPHDTPRFKDSYRNPVSEAFSVISTGTPN